MADQLSGTGFLIPFWPLEVVRRMGSYGSHLDLQVYDPHLAFKIIVQVPFGSPYGFLRGLQNPHGSRMGSFDF